MSEDKIDKLYKNYDILSAAEDKLAVSFFSHYDNIPQKRLQIGSLKCFCDSILPVSHILLSFHSRKEVVIFQTVAQPQTNFSSFFYYFSQHKREYQEILDAAHGSEKEKKLAAQFIAKFFKSFPDMMETALDRQLDLCEDEDVLVSFE